MTHKLCTYILAQHKKAKKEVSEVGARMHEERTHEEQTHEERSDEQFYIPSF